MKWLKQIAVELSWIRSELYSIRRLLEITEKDNANSVINAISKKLSETAERMKK